MPILKVFRVSERPRSPGCRVRRASHKQILVSILPLLIRDMVSAAESPVLVPLDHPEKHDKPDSFFGFSISIEDLLQEIIGLVETWVAFPVGFLQLAAHKLVCNPTTSE